MQRFILILLRDIVYYNYNRPSHLHTNIVNVIAGQQTSQVGCDGCDEYHHFPRLKLNILCAMSVRSMSISEQSLLCCVFESRTYIIKY